MMNILVIDKDKTIAKVIFRALSGFGHRVLIACGGQTGVRLFDNEFFDLVITEITMTVMDGHAVVRYVRNSERPKTPVIGISGAPWLVRATEFDIALTKPFTIQSLYNAVENLTGQRLNPSYADRFPYKIALDY